jgi:GxxExxY protein
MIFMTEREMNHLTERVIGIAIAVHRRLGPGQEEVMYEEALLRSLIKAGIACVRQAPLPLIYDGCVLDCDYRLDLVVEDALVLELKSVAALLPIHEAQLMTYLRISGKKIGLLMNFNVLMLKDGIRRRVHGLGMEPKVFIPWASDKEASGLNGQIIQAAVRVHSKVGPGLLRSSYLACMTHELEQQHVKVERKRQTEVKIEGLILEQRMEVEMVVGSLTPVLILSVDDVTPLIEAQFRAKLRLGGWTEGLVLNFNAELMKNGLKRVAVSSR